MRIDAAFPSTYLKAADLTGRNVQVTMNYVKMEDIGGDHKPILYFVGKEKGLVLNKTNSNNIMFLYGAETDEWSGKPVVLYPTMVDFQGKSVEAIRVKGPANGNGAARGATAQHPYAPPEYQQPAPRHPVITDDLDGDQIPF